MVVPLTKVEQQKIKMFIPDETYIYYFAAEKFDAVWRQAKIKVSENTHVFL